ncbi:MAG: putative glycosyltransferase [Parcubacteria group bacterium Gr01-1014_56]|nr:MAG: putative glycosyltransferase [Parcubacteria group bacterium Gr01-1014_56]
MKALVITGDKHFGPGHPRYELQKSVVERLEVVYWSKGSIWSALPTGHFDVVTVQDPFWRGLFALWAARRLKARFNVQIHTDLAAQSLLRHILAQIVLRHADSVRVVSEKIKAQVIAAGVYTKISILPVFVDFQKFHSVVRQPHLPLTILWIGRFEKEKDPLRAISVLEEVRKEGINAKLVMIGTGSMQQDVIKKANNLPIIEILGWQDPRIHLDTADVVLCTSWHESWGASIVEALAAGIPVVAPDVGIAREAGAIVVSRNELAQAVIKALQSNANGELKLKLLTREEWGRAWKDSLI